ncbi:MAG: putative esterase [Vicingaceae bacterium]|jgi:predicted esterase
MKHKLIVNRTAHYYHEPAEGPTKGIIIAIHGYAQLASVFIKDFKELSSYGYAVYAPEAFSKFYNRDRKPVASWMTLHEREDEVGDYSEYLEKLMLLIIEKNPSTPIHLVGFSQGVSTVLRWYASSTTLAVTVHLIAGSIPEELSLDNLKQLTANRYYYYHGTKDRLVKENQVHDYLNQLTAIGIDYNTISFDGRHEVPKELIELFKTYTRS